MTLPPGTPVLYDGARVTVQCADGFTCTGRVCAYGPPPRGLVIEHVDEAWCVAIPDRQIVRIVAAPASWEDTARDRAMEAAARRLAAERARAGGG